MLIASKISKQLVGDFNSVDGVDLSYVVSPAEIENNFDTSNEREVRQERISRLFRDAKNRIIAGLISNLNTEKGWDRCYESCDYNFFNSLELDHDSISDVAQELVIHATKLKKHVPESWRQIASGQFNWQKEAEYQNLSK
jgi:predicted alpha-1,6-mannanase (GH76 family)